ncbi:nickel transporter permease [Archaeoglobus veneficus]|uniref:ABC-type transporter, integral membrane subunit n=1 Tax=Archaeoglobus veneficus (strain DSM 11195 / SNP6) TaxID=693661 RepID=F2KQ40_ARCVS|nr:nickel transporter permease [Archaeoglobus veneficus]AEA47643.1 ABC-type transporter, integral membrane subunit [Archaeoglobus veneficus SNP6]
MNSINSMNSVRKLKTSIAMILLLLALGIFAPLISPYDPNELNLKERLVYPCVKHPFGTDNFGRDVFSRVLHGARVSLFVAMSVVMLTASIGVGLGIVAGYYGGVVDNVIMRIVDVLLAFPNIILAIVILGIFGPSYLNLVLALAAVWWVSYARMVRSVVLSLKESEFILAVKALGASNFEIMVRHVLPNALSPILPLMTLDLGSAILAISGLGFLGLGLQPPTPEWGVMLRDALPFMETHPYLMVFPGFMIMVSVLAFNMLGDSLRDVLDPRALERKFES